MDSLIRSTKTVVDASLESFVHKALKDEQIECIHRIVCHPWERCFGRATDGIRQERYISVNFKCVVSYGYSQRHIKNHLRTPCFLLAYKVNGTFTKFCF